jgi:hypothetical protein
MRRVVSWQLIALLTASQGLNAQGSWAGVRALISGQRIEVTTKGRTIRSEFQSATDDVLVVTRRMAIKYIPRTDVDRVVAYTAPDGKHTCPRTFMGLGVGILWGGAIGQGAGTIGFAVTMPIATGIGRWRDHVHDRTNQQRTVVVYQR